MQILLLVLGILLASFFYLFMFFMTGWKIYKRGLEYQAERRRGEDCWCWHMHRNMHYVPAVIGGLLWFAYWIHRLGRAVDALEWNSPLEIWRRHQIAKLEHEETIKGIVHKNELTALRRKAEKEAAQQNLSTTRKRASRAPSKSYPPTRQPAPRESPLH